MRLLPLLALAGAAALAPAAAAGTLHVDADLTTGAGDGSSWADAFRGPDGLQAALAAALPGDRIFVAEGLYLPSASGDRGASFALLSGVELYGGFLGTESSPAERPPLGTAPSVLSGDLAGDDAGSSNLGDNSYHVLTTAGADATAVLDGFTVRAGFANGGGGPLTDRGAGILCTNGASPTVRHCRFVAHTCVFGGGAGYISSSAAPSFADTRFEDCDGGSFGGAFDIAGGGGVTFDRCLFARNTAARAGALEIFATSGVRVRNSVFVDNVATGNGGGGAIWAGSGGNPRVLSCTLVGNRSTGQAVGGIRDQGTNSLTVVNTILWDNEGPGGAQAADNQVSASATVTYSLVEGGVPGTGNTFLDPDFVDAAAGDLRLASFSPAIDAGNGNALGAAFDQDFAGAPRFVDDYVSDDDGPAGAAPIDIGAHEYQPPAITIVAGCTGTPGALSTASAELRVGQPLDLSFTAPGLGDGAALFYVGALDVDVNGCGLFLAGLGELLLLASALPPPPAVVALSAGSAAVVLPVPNSPALAGQVVALQAAGADGLAIVLSTGLVAPIAP